MEEVVEMSDQRVGDARSTTSVGTIGRGVLQYL